MLEAAAMVTRLWTDKAWTRPITTDKEAEMADKDKSGIEMLRELAKDVSHNSLYEILKEGREDKWGAERFGGSVKESLLSIAGRIERERAEELAAAKRGLTDEARVVVERTDGVVALCRVVLDYEDAGEDARELAEEVLRELDGGDAEC